MPTFHKYLGESIAAIFLILFVWGTIFWIRNKNPGTYFWGLLGLGQVLLGLQPDRRLARGRGIHFSARVGVHTHRY